MNGNSWVTAALVAAGVFVSVSVSGAAPASAQSCADLVERFAADHSLSASPPPTAVPSTPGSAGSTTSDSSVNGAASSERLAQSGGVVAPPAVGDTAVIEPPRAGSSNMPTAPAVRPDAGPGTSGSMGGSTGDAMAPAARNAQMESLVTAARSAAKNGDEARCMESLSQARRLSQTAPGGTGGGG